MQLGEICDDWKKKKKKKYNSVYSPGINFQAYKG